MAMLREGKLSNWIGYALEYIQADQPVTHMIEADRYVLWLRTKIEQDPKTPRLIQTVYGVGYCFTPDG